MIHSSIKFFLAASQLTFGLLSFFHRSFFPGFLVFRLLDLHLTPWLFPVVFFVLSVLFTTIMASRHGIRLLSCLQPQQCKVAVVILHTDCTKAEHSLLRPKLHILQQNSIFLCAADSGANFLYDHCRTDTTEAWVPDLIAGDFDSIRPEVLEYYRIHTSAEIVHTPDQDETDFTKALQLTVKHLKSKSLKADFIVAVTSGNGRLDHVMGNINTLFRAHLFTDIPVVMISDCQMQFALDRAGDYEFKMDVGLEGPGCGIIPMRGPCHVITSGLKWDLAHQKLEFGGLVSTSNQLQSSVLRIRTDEPLLWTMDVKDVVVPAVIAGLNGNHVPDHDEVDRDKCARK